MNIRQLYAISSVMLVLPLASLVCCEHAQAQNKTNQILDALSLIQHRFAILAIPAVRPPSHVRSMSSAREMARQLLLESQARRGTRRFV